MDKAEKTKEPWQERKTKIKYKWAVPFIFAEWLCERFSYLLERWAFLDILGHAGRLTILIALIFYFMEADERRMQSENQRKAKHYQAWQVINSAQGKTGAGGRMEALQDLNGDGVSLAGVDISKAHLTMLKLKDADLNQAKLAEADLAHADLAEAMLALADITKANLNGTNLAEAILLNANLADADLWGANLTEATLIFANLAGANLNGANLAGANLTEANLAGIKDWQKVKSIANTNIYGVKNPPQGFVEWAKEHGAVSIDNQDEWQKLINEKRRKGRSRK